MSDDYWLFQSFADDRIVADVVEVLERGTWWSNGPEIDEFESLMAGHADRDHGVAFNSGTSALYATLHCLGVNGNEVIVPSFTYPATANAVVAAGGRPVFADIERDSLALDVDDVRRRITDDTAGIVPVHFAGDVCADVFELRRLADEHDLFLLEDAAHSPGATADGESVGSFGTAAAFSFAFNKLISTGEGGMVVTDDDDLVRRLERFRMQGRDRDETFVTWGHNLTMSSITAAIGVSQAERLGEIIERRREMASVLDDVLSDVDGVETPTAPPERDPVYFLYNLRLPSREHQQALRSRLADDGIPSRVTYEPTHLTEYYRSEWGYREGDLPVTEAIAGRVLTLPFHLDLDASDLRHIGERVVSHLES